MQLNRIYQGDCLELLKELDDECVDLVVTDPPYGIGYRRAYGARTKRPVLAGDTPSEALDLLRHAARELARVMRDGTAIYVFCPGGKLAFKQGAALVRELEPLFEIRQILVWDKLSIGMGRPWRAQYELAVMASRGRLRTWRGGNSRSNILRYRRPRALLELHPTPKPVELVQELIACTSAPGDLVLDPFAGSGTTCLAAKRLGRRYLGFELNPDYVATARKRIETESGEKPFRRRTKLSAGGRR